MQSVIIETVSGCNLNCDYCYAKDNFTDKKINLDVVDQILDKYSIFDEARMTWHGGEPLLRGRKFFEDVLELEDNYSTSFKNVVQTNATLLDKKFAQFFKENDFKICSSLDGPKEMHNAHRKFPNGEGTFEKVLEGIENLDKVGLEYSLVAVITKDKIGREKEFFDFLKERTDSIELNPVIMEGKTISDEELFQFYKNMYDLWMEDGGIDIGPLKQITKSMFSGSNQLCTYTPNCSEIFLGISHDGKVYPCGRFIGEKEFELGNIKDGELKDFYKKKGDLILSPKETDCKFYPTCGCGCYYDNYKVTGNLNKPAHCEMRKELLRYMKRDLEERL